jgi:hypothetical protein
MNRCVRGILGGLESAGVAASYPGRDTITAGGRLLGLVSFETDANGALLFEAILGVGRDFGIMPHLLDRADPEGVLTVPMSSPDETVSLARLLGAAPRLDELAAWLCGGYAARFGLAFAPERPARLEAEPDDDDTARVLPRHARAAVMLGSLEVDLALGADGRIAEVAFRGDFIANSPGIARLERALRGCPPEAAAVESVVDGVFAGQDDFILGIGPPRTLAATILCAAGA